MLKNGLVQIYTGNGKGKTTAAIGQAVRAAGHNNSIIIYQFLKPSSLKTAERPSLEKLGIEIRTIDLNWDMKTSLNDPNVQKEMKKVIAKTLEDIKTSAQNKEFDIIVLDELAYCASIQLADIDKIIEIINSRDNLVEMIITGRDAPQELIDAADLVTEMKKIKHPFDKGINAREGIEF